MRCPKPDLDCCTTEKNISLIARNRDSSVNTVIWYRMKRWQIRIRFPAEEPTSFTSEGSVLLQSLVLCWG